MKSTKENTINVLRPCTSVFLSRKQSDHSGALLFLTTKKQNNLMQGRGIGNDLVGTSFPCYALRPQFYSVTIPLTAFCPTKPTGFTDMTEAVGGFRVPRMGVLNILQV